MAFSLRKNFSGGAVGLDIDGRYLAAAQVEGGRVIAWRERRAAGRASSPTARCVNRDGLAEALKSFVAEAACRRTSGSEWRTSRSSSAWWSCRASRTRSSATPPSASRRPRRSRCRSTRPCSTTSSPATPRRPTAPPRMQVVLVAARRSMIEALLEAVEGRRPQARGRRPRRVRARAHAGGRRRRPARATAARVYCHLGGVSNLAIAVGLGLLLHPAAVGGLGRRGRRRALADEIRLSIDYYMTQAQAKPVGEVVLSGPGLGRGRSSSRASACTLASPTTVAGAARRARPLGARRRSEDPHRLHRGRRASRWGAAA